MQIDRRITNGLAWAGVVLVIGVPLADMVTGQLMGDGATSPAKIAMVEPVAPVAPVPAPLSARPSEVVAKPAAVATASQPVVPAKPADSTPPAMAAQPEAVTTIAVAPAGQAQGDVVDSYIKSGKPLPSYITGAPTTQAAAPVQAPAAVTAATNDPLETATLAPAKVAPIPMPLSMRPEPALVVEERPRIWSTQISPKATPRSSATVTYGDLQDWETGPLSEFLARRQAAPGRVDPNYDPDGFYLDEGPNGVQSRDRLLGPAEPLVIPFSN